MAIRCVTIDLDDTLWDCGSVISAAEKIFYDWLAESYPRITSRLEADALIHHRRAFFKTVPELNHDVTALRKRWLEKLAQEFGYSRDLVEPGFRLFWEHRNAVELYEEAGEVLSRLRSRFAVGAITNGNADVDFIGIGHYFDFVVTSAAAGAAKPSPVIFEKALARAEVKASDAVHVGDDPITDIRGAKEAGMRAVWFNPGKNPWPSGPRPDAEISSLRQLDDALNALVVSS